VDAKILFVPVGIERASEAFDAENHRNGAEIRL
jgi:hypothetical protein